MFTAHGVAGPKHATSSATVSGFYMRPLSSSARKSYWTAIAPLLSYTLAGHMVTASARSFDEAWHLAPTRQCASVPQDIYLQLVILSEL